jgi:adenylate cyclase class 2
LNSSYHQISANVANETEVKLSFKGSAEDAHTRIERAGFTRHTPRTLERDQLFDLPSASLRAQDQVLRLRLESNEATKQWTLTYKGPAARERYKIREEIETRVEDGENFVLILSRLGYIPVFRYEKYRTKFCTSPEHGLVTVDETPMGVFLELEGAREWIDETAIKLGFSPSDYVVSSYAALWKDYRRRDGRIPENMVFLLQDVDS